MVSQHATNSLIPVNVMFALQQSETLSLVSIIDDNYKWNKVFEN